MFELTWVTINIIYPEAAADKEAFPVEIYMMTSLVA